MSVVLLLQMMEGDGIGGGSLFILVGGWVDRWCVPSCCCFFILCFSFYSLMFSVVLNHIKSQVSDHYSVDFLAKG